MRTRRDDALACGPAGEAHVEEAAERQPHQRRKCCCEDENHVKDEYTGVETQTESNALRRSG